MPRQFSDVTRRIPIVLSGTMSESLVPAWRTSMLTVVELATAAFFLSGIAGMAGGIPAPWFVLAAVIAAIAARAADVEGWALFVPGGLAGRVKEAFGHRLAAIAAAAVLVERLLFVALAAVAAAHYVVAAVGVLFPTPDLSGQATIDDVTSLLAAVLVGVIWLRTRVDRPLSATDVVRWMWIPLLLPFIVTVWGVATLSADWSSLPALSTVLLGPEAGNFIVRPLTWSHLLVLAAGAFVGFGYVVPGIGTGFGVTRLASELPQPRLRSLRRTLTLSATYSLIVVAVGAVVFGALVPDAVRSQWIDAPLAGLVWHVHAPTWLRSAALAALTGAAVLMLGYAAQTGLTDADTTLQRLSRQGILSEALRVPHAKFGRPTRLTDIAAAAIVVAIVVSGGRLTWLARAYGAGVVWTLLFGLAALFKLRAHRPEAAPGRQTTERGRRHSLRWILTGLVVGGSGIALLMTGDPGTWAATSALGALSLVFVAASKRVAAENADVEEGDAFRLLPSTDLALDRVDARPGNVLVAVRHPYSLGHLSAALQQAGDRDIVVMTARLLGRDVEDDGASGNEPTDEERFLFSQVTAAAERYGRAVRLLIVPAHDAFDAVIAAVLRLKSSEVYVGESMTLSAHDQARQLGDAWERADKAEHLKVRLVIFHRSGRTHAYFLGAHAPALSDGDLDLIHQLWLDATKAIGAHVHHHDIVRAALTQMAQQMNGPHRDEAVEAVRQVAQPAEEIAAFVRSRDFPQLRDTVRNRSPHDVAEMLSRLAIEEQVIAFRVLPRRDAAAIFEYLSQESQEALLKAMGQEEIAALLNDMAPDDRTMFLEELPASVTRQLLAMLTPEERSVALTLLGYPEGSIGRLMTPHYVAVREEWTVQQVLDYVREHGQDSETLNVLYVVNDQDLLIDDVRIRELLLSAPNRRVADLMDRRFVALKATDDQAAAVSVFRQNDRVALPVTDTAGLLIGIVTIDDVLHVAEAVATKEIQRIGGSEAFDEPYMKIAFGSMIQKRAGWLTALFIGEMLTATAMGFFEAEISKAVVLALFIPLIISSGGNSGSQASTLVIRALALGEVTLGDWWRVMRREVAAGLSLGGILGSVGFLRITVWSAFYHTYGPHWLLIAIAVALSIVGVVLWGTLVGSLLPFVLRRLGFDPATSSAPFVATLVDVTGLVIYFSVAIVLLSGTLL